MGNYTKNLKKAAKWAARKTANAGVAVAEGVNTHVVAPLVAIAAAAGESETLPGRVVDGAQSLYNSLHYFGTAYAQNMGIRDFLHGGFGEAVDQVAQLGKNIFTEPQETAVAVVVAYGTVRGLSYASRITRRNVIPWIRGKGRNQQQNQQGNP